MKKVIFGMLILIVSLFCLPSCAPAISEEEYNAVQSELDNAQQKIDKLAEDLAVLRADYESMYADYESLHSDYESMYADYESLQSDYKNLLERLKQSTLKNPTWSELKEFLELDDTDTLPYIEASFDCTGFAITLRDNAWKYGIRCAYVEVDLGESNGHALNAFETTDRGLIYVDNTEVDQIAYVGINQPYGAIHLAAVKVEHIACTGSPAEFWSSLTYSTHSSPFSYDYYIGYQQRVKFYKESIEVYNKAVDEYNKGSTKWSYSQLTMWLDNLEALKRDLGSIIYEPMGMVESIEVYWN